MRAWDVCLTHDPVYGGIYRSVCNFARALDGSILSFDDGRSDRSRMPDERPTVRIACRPRAFNRECHVVTPGMAREAAAHLAGAELLVVHSLFRGHAPWAAGWAQAHGRPYWSVLEGCLDPWGLQRRSLAKRLWLWRHGRAFFENAAAVICGTFREQAKAAPLLGNARSVVIHWPVLQPALDGRDQARSSFRAAHQIPAAARVLLFVGRLHPMKRPAHLIDAFVQAAGRTAPNSATQPAHLVVVGMEEGVTRHELSARVPAALRGRVHLVGPLAGEALAEAFLASDGFVSLSHRENFGYSFAEALSYGLPAIVSPGHDLAHDLAHDVAAGSGEFPAGWCLGTDDLAEAVAAIEAFSAAPEGQLNAMGAEGRRWASDHLSFERFRERVRELFASGR